MKRNLLLAFLLVASLFVLGGCGTCPCSTVPPVADDVAEEEITEEVAATFTFSACFAFVPSATDEETTCETLTVTTETPSE